MEGAGGGGLIAGLANPNMIGSFDGAIAESYAAVGSNAGIHATDVNGSDADTWALLQTGTVDIHMVKHFAYRGLKDMIPMGKDVIKLFYSEPPTYSYFSRCSGGGRQGYVFAQRLPDAFDGIAACAPGLYWDQAPEYYWPHMLMDLEKSYRLPCELNQLREAALEACCHLCPATRRRP
jgi:hypothetical protein